MYVMGGWTCSVIAPFGLVCNHEGSRMPSTIDTRAGVWEGFGLVANVSLIGHS
jgi:hypothetical protein